MRLIDADALFAKMKERHDMYAGCSYVGDKARQDELGAVMGDIVNAPTIGGWISVKDRLPDAAGYECLVCAVNENYNQTHVFTAHTGYGEPGWWTGNVHYMSRVTSPSDNRLHPALNVTHWMPLPEPPKEEEHGSD